MWYKISSQLYTLDITNVIESKGKVIARKVRRESKKKEGQIGIYKVRKGVIR